MPTKPFRKEKFPVYFTSIERLIIKHLADNAQLSVSEWIRRTTLQSPEFIQEQQVFNRKGAGAYFQSRQDDVRPFFGEGIKRNAPLFGDGSDNEEDD